MKINFWWFKGLEFIAKISQITQKSGMTKMFPLRRIEQFYAVMRLKEIKNCSSIKRRKTPKPYMSSYKLFINLVDDRRAVISLYWKNFRKTLFCNCSTPAISTSNLQQKHHIRNFEREFKSSHNQLCFQVPALSINSLNGWILRWWWPWANKRGPRFLPTCRNQLQRPNWPSFRSIYRCRWNAKQVGERSLVRTLSMESKRK